LLMVEIFNNQLSTLNNQGKYIGQLRTLNNQKSNT
jgi:hypothetical protein